MLALPSTKSKNEFILDALPYIDDVEYNDTHRKFALQMIEQEQKVFPMTKDYLKKFAKPNYEIFLTDRLKAEWERISEKRDSEKLDVCRYEVPSPKTTPLANDRNAWIKGINNCAAQIENQRIRKLNLELMADYLGESYLRMNKALQLQADNLEQSVYGLRSQLFELHSRRKRRQEDAGEKLVQLGSQWINEVNKNIKLGQACDRLEEEIRSKKKCAEIEK